MNPVTSLRFAAWFMLAGLIIHVVFFDKSDMRAVFFLAYVVYSAACSLAAIIEGRR